MKLWLLRPKDDRPNKGINGLDPWEPWYDSTFGMVIRAETEQEARHLANKKPELPLWVCTYGDEGPVWEDENLVTCVELTSDGEPGLIIQDFAAA